MIQLEHVTKRYGAATAVDDVSLSVRSEEMLVLLGGSGSGKTTTLKMINRLIPLTSGRISIAGRDQMALEPHVLRRKIGYCFQGIGLFPHMNVGQNIGITPSLLGWSPKRIAQRVEELLDLVDLPADFAHRMPSALSGGQKQRVGVARALAAKPRVVLFDEPFGALDPLTRDHLQRSLRRIRRELGLTAVFVTHDMVEAILLGDRIAVLKEGTLVQIGSPAQLMKTPADAYVRQLMETPARQAEEVEALIASTPRTLSNGGPRPGAS